MIGAEELHVLTCVVQRGAIVASTSPYRPGGTTIDFGTPAASTTVACRVEPLDSVQVERLTGGGKTATIVATHYLYMAYQAAPASLVDQDSTPSPEALHRIVTVKRADGSVLDTGPFEIIRIVDLAGAADVLKIELRRVV